MKYVESEDNIQQSCHFLGIPTDPLVSFYFPNRQNFCFRIKKPESINLHHQELYCLTGKHIECIVFKEDIKHFPKEIIGEISVIDQNYKIRNILIFLGAIIVFVILMTNFYLNYFEPGLIQAASPLPIQNIDDYLPTNNPTKPASSNQIDLLFLLPAKTVNPTQLIPSETLRLKSPTAGPGISTPFGIIHQYLLHQVKSGESLLYIANLYETKVDVLIFINSLEGAPPIRIGQIIIVKPGALSTSEVERLDAILLKEDTTIESVAEIYSSTTAELINLNALGDLKTIPIGRWLIIPQK